MAGSPPESRNGGAGVRGTAGPAPWRRGAALAPAALLLLLLLLAAAGAAPPAPRPGAAVAAPGADALGAGAGDTVGRAPVASARAGLGPDSVAAGYREWLDSLARTEAALTGAGLSEDRALYPYGRSRVAIAEGPELRYLAVARALDRLEGGGAGIRATAFSALAMARNYANLSEHDSARVWFALAARLDTAGAYEAETGRGLLAAALAAGDSLESARALVNAVGHASVLECQDELVLVYRHLLTAGDDHLLGMIADKVAGESAGLGASLRCWHARALARLGRRREAVGELLRLVAGGASSGGLGLPERATAAVLLPEMLAADGRRTAAAAHYRLLAGGHSGGLAAQGDLGLADLAFAAARYDTAAARYRLLCERPELPDLREHLCEMARLAELLAQITREGEPYGLDARGRP